MKSVLTFFAVVVFIYLTFYLGASIWIGSFNLKDWTEGTRHFVAFSPVITAVGFFVLAMIGIFG